MVKSKGLGRGLDALLGGGLESVSATDTLRVLRVEQLQPGDLVFFNTLKSAFSHVGIYLGDGRFIHAPSSGGGIHVVDMNESYWAKRFNGARRLPPTDQQPSESSAE